MNDTVRGVIFACACAVGLSLILWGISCQNLAVPWPAMDNPKTEEKSW